MKLLKIIAFILALTTFTNTFCILFYVKNDFVRPLEAIITVTKGSREGYGKDNKELRGWVKPGDEIQLDAHGGWLTHRISSSDPYFYTGNDYIYDIHSHTNHDQDIKFHSDGHGNLVIEAKPSSR